MNLRLNKKNAQKAAHSNSNLPLGINIMNHLFYLIRLFFIILLTGGLYGGTHSAQSNNTTYDAAIDMGGASSGLSNIISFPTTSLALSGGIHSAQSRSLTYAVPPARGGSHSTISHLAPYRQPSLSIDAELSNIIAFSTRELDGLIHQRILPDQNNYVLGGTLGNSWESYTIVMDFHHLDLDPGSQYYVEFTMDDKSQKVDALPSNGRIFGQPTVEKNLWLVRIPQGTTALDLDDLILSSWRLRGSFLFSGYSYHWPISAWPPARYTYKVKKESLLIDSTLEEGDFVLGRLESQHNYPFSGVNPIILLHGYASDATFFAGERNGLLDYSDPESIAGRMAESRPVYTLEVPNTGDLFDSAEVLADALYHTSLAHHRSEADVVAHSMGGLITRVYKQFYSGNPDYLGRYVTLGSPLEGTVFGEIASGGYLDSWLSSVIVAGSLYVDQSEWDAFGVGEMVNTPAAEQLAAPQETLGLWSNKDTQVAQDGDYLAVLGTTSFAIEGNLVTILGLTKNPLHLDLFGNILDSNRLADAIDLLRGSDGLTTWDSGGKRPKEQRLNLYVSSNHMGYNTPLERSGLFGGNADLPVMLEAIHYFLDRQTVDDFVTVAPPDPVEELQKATIRVIDETGQAVQNAMIAIVTDVQQQTVRIVSTLSDAAGNAFAVLPNTLSQGQQLVAIAVGMEMIILAEGQEFLPRKSAGAAMQNNGSQLVLPSEIILKRDQTYTGPVGTAVVINGGGLSTSVATLMLTLSGDNVAMVRVSEPGLTGDWIPYAPELHYILQNTDPGEKTINVEFASSDSTIGPVVTGNIFYSIGVSGSIHVLDDRGGAEIYVNNKPVGQTTPAMLSNLPVGTYTISLVHPDHDFLSAAMDVEVVQNQTTRAVFTSSSPAHLWLKQNLAPNFQGPQRDLTADPDNDGQSNLVEYALGTDPGVADAQLGLQVLLDPPESGARIRFLARTNDPALVYTCRISHDNTNWQTITLTFDPHSQLWLTNSSEFNVEAVLLPDGRWEITLVPSVTVGFLFAEMAARYNLTQFDFWLEDRLPIGLPDSLRGQLQDADNDGLSNLLEYGLGMNPAGVDPEYGWSMGYDPATLEFRTHLRVRSNDPYLEYRCLFSADLTNWTQAILRYETASGSWTSDWPNLVIRSATDQGNGWWNLELANVGIQPMPFLRLKVVYWVAEP